mmetsp:Transcript_13627/g.45420  ORF Transcript_13627/g.45420 Transcript_13627/m.45420 type:complete len:200 (-) Transcript_13627:210-809(-)
MPRSARRAREHAAAAPTAVHDGHGDARARGGAHRRDVCEGPPRRAARRGAQNLRRPPRRPAAEGPRRGGGRRGGARADMRVAALRGGALRRRCRRRRLPVAFRLWPVCDAARRGALRHHQALPRRLLPRRRAGGRGRRRRGRGAGVLPAQAHALRRCGLRRHDQHGRRLRRHDGHEHRRRLRRPDGHEHDNAHADGHEH